MGFGSRGICQISMLVRLIGPLLAGINTKAEGIRCTRIIRGKGLSFKKGAEGGSTCAIQPFWANVVDAGCASSGAF